MTNQILDLFKKKKKKESIPGVFERRVGVALGEQVLANLPSTVASREVQARRAPVIWWIAGVHVVSVDNQANLVQIAALARLELRQICRMGLDLLHQVVSF